MIPTVEADEPVSVTLSSPSANAVLAVDNVGSSSFTNDDSSTISIDDPSSVAEGDAGTATIDFTVSIDASDPGNNITVDYSISGGNEDGTGGTLTFLAGTATLSQTVSVTTNGDTTVEADEPVSVTLSSPSANAVLAVDNVGSSSFTNDDSSTISIDDPSSVAEGDVGTATIDFTVSIDASDPGNNITVDYSISGGNEDGTGGTLTFLAGTATLSQTVSVTTNGDTSNVEADEPVSVTLSSPSANAVLAVDNVGSSSFTNDDTDAISIGNVTLAEGDAGTTSFTFTVSVDGGGNAASNIDFTYDTANNTATTGDSDYVAVSGGSGTITAGSPSTTITIDVNGDTDVELNESFFVDLSNPVNATIATGRGVGTITNDDEPVVTLTGTDLTSTESGTTTGTVTVNLSASVTNLLTINLTLGGTASTVSGTDYTLGGTGVIWGGGSSLTVNIPAGETSPHNYLNTGR